MNTNSIVFMPILSTSLSWLLLNSGTPSVLGTFLTPKLRESLSVVLPPLLTTASRSLSNSSTRLSAGSENSQTRLLLLTPNWA
ncbi:hypothetical protein OWV82_000285 [Melia azedarach]|uniref:Uncharacterized protein n=1 Tax=Melia azedarach TaxID=155640 RepID=A0ACC1YTT0_MELAZ|nr:hypothetical protein OWV82_000285 [Melia azedarach]